MKFYYPIALLVITFLFSACDQNRIYEDTASFQGAYWLADSIKYFEFQIPEENQGYNILLSIRNGREYPHSNLYVQYGILDSTGNKLDEELRNFQLFNSKSGYPFGNGSGNIFEHNFDLLSAYEFPYAGKFLINVQQYMRYDSLPEIYSVGLRIEKTEP